MRYGLLHGKSATRACTENPKEVPIKSPQKKMWLQAAGYSYVGIFFGISIVIGYLGGAWADRRLHTAPWLMMLGVLCGIAAGFKELYRLARQFQRESKHKEDHGP